MKIIIVGFKDYDKLDRIMQKLIEDSQCYLFAVVVNNKEDLGFKWAEKNGAPVEWIKVKNIDDLVRAADYLVAGMDKESYYEVEM